MIGLAVGERPRILEARKVIARIDGGDVSFLEANNWKDGWNLLSGAWFDLNETRNNFGRYPDDSSAIAFLEAYRKAVFCGLAHERGLSNEVARLKEENKQLEEKTAASEQKYLDCSEEKLGLEQKIVGLQTELDNIRAEDMRRSVSGKSLQGDVDAGTSEKGEKEDGM